MSLLDDPPLRDFPDRAIRRLLLDFHNLGELITDAAGDIGANLDFERARPIEREFLLEDWRRREADLFFRVPWRTPADAPPALVCVLLEHQSVPDPPMPLRTLLYAVFFWEQEWKTWEAGHPRGQPLRLTPVLPVVFHTGLEPWQTNRQMIDLIVGPEAMRPFAPQWPMLFWDLANRSTDSLLASASAWLRALAVVRAEQAEADVFEQVFTEVIRRMDPLRGSEGIRRKDLLWFVISWALRRRPTAEKPHLKEVARSSQTTVEQQTEVEDMTRIIDTSWEAVERRKVAEAALQSVRTMLLALLQKRFGTIPEAVVQRVQSATDLARLQACGPQVLEINSPEELDL